MARDFNWTLGLDIGSFHINAVIADIGQANEIIVKGIGNSMTTGISRGQIVSPTDLAQSIDRAIKRAEREAGFRPTDVVVSVLPYQITFGYSSGLVIPRRSGGRITEEDKINCVQKSKNAIKSLDQLLIHAIPLEFTLDGKTVAEPTGKTGNSLEVNTHFVLGNAANIQAILQSTQALRLRVAGMIYTPIATAQMALSDIERQEGALLIEIGARFTTVSLFRRGILQSAMAIPVGGETITNDICQCLAVTPPEAERIKVLYGSADPTQVDPRERLEITSPEKGRHEIKRAYLCKIISSRIQELLQLIRRRAQIGPEFPYDIVLTGGTTGLKGISELTQRILGHPIRIGPPGRDTPVGQQSTHLTALGLIRYALITGAITSTERNMGVLERLNQKLSRWF